MLCRHGGREVLREALLNAVVHKAYESLTPIQIAVYDDKLEIFNCGYLPEGWTVDNLLGTHRSRPYNPDVANVFFRAGEIETWGRGIERIVMACKSYGCPTPTVRYSSGEMWMVFYFREENLEGSQKGSQKSSQKIIELIRQNPNITTSEMAETIGVNRRTVAKITKTLQTKGIIQRVGPDKGGHWEIVKK